MSAQHKDRLSVVVRLREITESRRQAELARANQALAARELAVAGARRAYEERPMAEEVRFSPVQLRALQLLGTGALEALHEANAARGEAEEERRGAADALTMATISRRSAERLSERRATEAARAAQIASERALDELVILQRAADRPEEA